MELIQIIYSVLMITGGLLVLIIGFSFFLSKINKENSQLRNEFKTLKNTGINKPVIYIPVSKKSKDYFYTPNIFNINNAKPKEVNIILKQTMIKSATGRTNNELKKTNSQKNNQRYTIVNDELYKKNNRAANYYL